MIINERKYVCRGSFRYIEDIIYLVLYLSNDFNFRLVFRNKDREIIIDSVNEVLKYFVDGQNYIFESAEFQFFPKKLENRENEKSKCVLSNSRNSASWYIEYQELDAIHIVPFTAMFLVIIKGNDERNKLISLPWGKIISALFTSLLVVVTSLFYVFHPLILGWFTFPLLFLVVLTYSIYMRFSNRILDVYMRSAILIYSKSARKAHKQRSKSIGDVFGDFIHSNFFQDYWFAIILFILSTIISILF